jgi:putative hemolysin
MSERRADVVAATGVADVLRGARQRAAGPFTVAGHFGWPAWLDGLVAPAVDRVLGLHAVQRLYTSRVAGGSTRFVESALAALDVALDVRGAAVPAQGGLLVVANHPRGALDGLALLAALRRVRADVRVLGNSWLAAVPPLRPSLVGVDVFGEGAARTRANVSSMRAAQEWLASGGCLLVFPAGEVASRVTSRGVAVDGDWHPHVAALAVRAGVPTMPVFVSGSNSRVFRALGRLHPLLRTAWLARELVSARGSMVRLTAGALVEAGALGAVPPHDRAPYLRARTYLLADERHDEGGAGERPAAPFVPVAPAVEPAQLAADVSRLPADRLMATSGGLLVYCARAAELPHVLPEIGRLREETFRAVGEGTGRARDLDRFDAHYCHLFAWDPARHAVVGAYRLGPTDDILPRYGLEGLYTSTLFRFDGRLLDRIGPALELGRSFVRQEYQREFTPLLALWKGIGQFISRAPRYRHVFGAVSISRRYASLTRALLVQFLSAAALHPHAARLVQPRHPLPPPPQAHLAETVTASTLEGVASLVRAIERDGKPMPVLLRQYLNLNARLLGFSVDPDFGDALDGLMLADLREVPRPMLARLVGKDAAAGLTRAWSAGREVHPAA